MCNSRSHDGIINGSAVYPQLGSGPNADNSGSGYYTREDYIDILKEAVKYHVKVIPEIDLPGHSNAAIKSNLYGYIFVGIVFFTICICM